MKGVQANHNSQFSILNSQLFSSEVSGNLAPLSGFPLDDGIAIIVSLQPSFGPFNNLKELFRLWRALQSGFALAFLDPENGVVAVAVDGFADTLILL